MRQSLGILKKSFKLVNHHMSLWVASTVIALCSVLVARWDGVGWFSFGLVVLLLGWLGTRFVFLYEMYIHRRLNWKALYKHLWRFSLDLGPLALVVFGVGVLSVVLATLVTGNLEYLGVPLIGEVFSGVLRVVYGSETSEVIGGNGWLEMLAGQALLLCILMGLLVMKLGVSVLVVEDVNVWRGMLSAYKFLMRHLKLYVSFLIFRVFANVGINVFFWVFSLFINLSLMGVSDLSSGWVWWVEIVFLHSLIAYVGLILDGYVLIYYVDANKKVSKPKKKVKRVKKK